MSPPIKKKSGQRRHAKNRALERYGLELNRIAYAEICRQIQNGKDVEFLERASLRVTVWLVRFRGKEIVCVYDKLRKNIASFLPPEWLERYRRRQKQLERRASGSAPTLSP